MIRRPPRSTLSLHDALPIFLAPEDLAVLAAEAHGEELLRRFVQRAGENVEEAPDRKSTRLNSSHGYISYAVFCLKKKKKLEHYLTTECDLWLEMSSGSILVS